MYYKYNSKLKETLDKHAPLKTKTVTVRDRTPWTNDDLKPWKTERRRLERKMRRTGLQVDKQEFNQFKWKYNYYLEKNENRGLYEANR